MGTERKDEEHGKFVLAAFTAYEMGAGGEYKFSEFLDAIGLGDKPPSMTPKQPERTKEEIYAGVEKTLERLRQMKKDKENGDDSLGINR